MNARTIIDEEHFHHMTGGDAALQAEVLALFRAQAGLWAKLLIADAPVHTWRDAAHSIKGSARGIGFWSLAEACETVEALAKSDVLDGPVVQRELKRVRQALEAAVAASGALQGEALSISAA
jgi:HPt (histidine-containing phosphotransfer) domain-containing protein